MQISKMELMNSFEQKAEVEPEVVVVEKQVIEEAEKGPEEASTEKKEPEGEKVPQARPEEEIPPSHPQLQDGATGPETQKHHFEASGIQEAPEPKKQFPAPQLLEPEEQQPTEAGKEHVNIQEQKAEVEPEVVTVEKKVIEEAEKGPEEVPAEKKEPEEEKAPQARPEEEIIPSQPQLQDGATGPEPQKHHLEASGIQEAPEPKNQLPAPQLPEPEEQQPAEAGKEHAIIKEQKAEVEP